MHRKVEGLCFAQRGEGPGFGTSRKRGAAAAGRAYEKALAKACGSAFEKGVWWRFTDANGPGWCQTDLVAFGDEILVLEAKYSWVPEGHTQISQLYAPVIGFALKKPVLGIVVCKRLVPGMPKNIRVCGTLDDALLEAARGRTPVLHWFGETLLRSTRLRPSVKPPVAQGSASLPAKRNVSLAQLGL